MEWFRFYHRALYDAKVQGLPAGLFKRWVNLLCLASLQDVTLHERGKLPNLAQIAFNLHVKISSMRSTMNVLVSLRLVDLQADETYAIHDWSDWQRDSDDVAQRVKRYRHAHRNVTVTGPEVDIDIDTDAIASGAPAPTDTSRPKSAHELRDEAIAGIQATTSQRDKVGVILGLWPLIFGSRYPPPDGGMVARMGTLAGGFGPVVNAMVSAAAEEITDDPRSYVMGVLNGRKRRVGSAAANNAAAIRRPGDTGDGSDISAALAANRYPPGWTARDGEIVRVVPPTVPRP